MEFALRDLGSSAMAQKDALNRRHTGGRKVKAEFLERYERRTASRRKFAIRDFDAARFASPPVDTDA